ncbi:unnamed protein product [Pneumocystis jirovecii]|uniref:DNA-directed RNA polymerase III subunit n=2 Tax=Pneumocystis jirovecii TaxID=42068 RepID=L0PEQ7_PNEJI|nr:uncharacterized protein T551_00300 [Pneumocystis jirovecii RU7]KTW32815.1 hypothetical protein T551_00300 [Pneumocystis jirovecii RU7]CCJ30848.1 unnamed protein product [Pneumocystis jirovecii]
MSEKILDEKIEVKYFKELHTKISKESPFYISMLRGLDKDTSDYVKRYSDKYKPAPKTSQSLFCLRLESCFFPEELFNVFLNEYKDQPCKKRKMLDPYVFMQFPQDLSMVSDEEMQNSHDQGSDTVDDHESRKEGNDQEDDFGDDDNNDYGDNYFDPGDEDYEDGTFFRDNIDDYL